MAFSKVNPIPNFPDLERSILDLWKERKVFDRSLEEAKGRPTFVFYEGPPTANGLPHNGHVLTRVIKDLFPRYRTMRGYRVDRKAGWDTHGLPVEVEVEKELRISGKQAILDYGVERFAERCIASVFRYTSDWEHLTERIGFWVNLSEAYVTYHKSYVESVWWALSELFKKGLLYKGHKVVWWWAQGGTALSAGEVGNAYKTVDDPSVYVRFPLRDEDASLVVWTTTPWTLPSNMFAAVHGEFTYAYARDDESGELWIVAEALVDALAEKWGRTLKVEKTVKGSELVGKRYRPPFAAFDADLSDEDERYFRIVLGDKSSGSAPQWFVTLEAGTGIVHIAPAFGEDDWKVWRNQRKENDAIEMFCAVRPDGGFDERLKPLGLEGTWVKDGDRALIKNLKETKLLVHAEQIRHEYPFCWRSDNDPLIQYAREAWFIKTTDKVDQVIENNQSVEWQPEHIRDGRFGDFLDGNVDWALSRERFWGTPLNVWVCDDCGTMDAPSSCAEIEAKNPEAFAAFHQAKKENPELSEHLIVHKPWIDQVEFSCDKCGGTMRRVPEVIDCWFDSGCMPFAQFGYPHQEGSKEVFERSFPADFISEAIDQTRGWFYSLMMVSSLLFEEEEPGHPYKRCIVLGHVLDKAGKKESKSSGNYTPPEVILDAVRMEFGVVEPKDEKAKPKSDKEVRIGFEDLDGLALKDGQNVRIYQKDAPDKAEEVKVRGLKGLPRRQVIVSDSLREKFATEFARSDVMPAEVPALPKAQRLALEEPSVPAPGADAFRWFFYASSPPWNNTRHALSNVRGLQKELPIKLRNVYAFFVTYANIDGFDPVEDEAHKRPIAERALLDRWILSELEKTKGAVVENMDRFRSYEATLALSEFVEALSNWYVRRSRDRFWAPGREQDKLDAYWTLFQVLRDLSLMLAPFLPFAAEDMYQNLVVKTYGERMVDSVHLRSYPSGDASRVDERLSKEMGQVRGLVSLGLQVRANEKVKIRQPLRLAQIVVVSEEERTALQGYTDVMAEELNVRSIQFVDSADEFVSYTVKPNFKSLGKRLGPKMKPTSKKIAEMDALFIKQQLEEKGVIEVEVDEESISLGADDLLISLVAKEGFSAAGASDGVVVLDTRIDEELRQDGLFREVLSKVQNQRKEDQLEYTDRIHLSLAVNEGLQKLCESRMDELQKETLATKVSFVSEATNSVSIEGEQIGIGIEVD